MNPVRLSAVLRDASDADGKAGSGCIAPRLIADAIAGCRS